MPPDLSRRVVIGLDGSPHSIAALRRGVAEAASRDAAVEIVHVIPDSQAGDEKYRKEHERMVEDLTEAALRTAPSLSVDKLFATGIPGPALCHRARDAELLVVGARLGGGPLSGSTVATVLSAAPCTVMICSTADLLERMSWSVEIRASSRKANAGDRPVLSGDK